MKDTARETAYPILDRLVAATGLHRLLRRRLAGSVIVLMYHKVLPDRIADECPHRKLAIRETVFAGQVAWLAKHARVLPLSEAVRSLGTGEESASPTVCLTFDDGYRDNAEIAGPLLEGAGLQATFFVTTGFIDGTPLWFDLAAHAHRTLGGEVVSGLADVGEEGRGLPRFLDRLKVLSPDRLKKVLEQLDERAPSLPDDLIYAAMSPEQVAALSDAGHEIASHGVTHSMLPALPPDEVSAELAESAERILEWTGKAPVGFCYPNGHSSEVVEAAVASAGYEYACSTTRGVNRPGRNLYRLRRRLISEENSATADGRHRDALFAGEVLGLHRIIRRTTGRARS